ncbi:MAG: hypothetical protein Q8927_07135 [Bacteroidota bacterium]|nr:hypothetical protein [Bacteroidota bacterium]MDP4215959.1 hypothetical protein [Bacteroidota bacterium]MDP4246764.1 hypothetical protein [Bacteroidota bacterium]MDP4253794.1 hypothetical protein [Bacteroidota bacterium]MDP4259604.1 hypothetical protein [Bacteroidota bacterium]
MKKYVLVPGLLLIISFGSVFANDGVGSHPNTPSHVRNILSTQLPVKLRSDVQKEFKSYWITELYRTGDKNHTAYTITVENPDRIVQMRSINAKTWVVVATKIKSE